MSLVDMKIADSSPEDYTPNPYGCGLCIDLTDDQVEALGLEDNPPAAGSMVSISAIAKVIRLTQEAEEGDDDNDIDVRLSLQITEMSIVPSDTVSTSNAANVLYGAADAKNSNQ